MKINEKEGARKTGSPILPDRAGHLDCRVVNTCDAGDHTIFTGEVVDAEVYEDNHPLLRRHKDFFQERFAGL